MGGRVEWVHLHQGKNIKVKGQLLGVSSISTSGSQGSILVVNFGGKNFCLSRRHAISKSPLYDSGSGEIPTKNQGEAEKPLRTSMKTVSEKQCLVGERFFCLYPFFLFCPPPLQTGFSV